MDQRSILIPDLTPQNDASPILVRVTRIWESINKETKQPLHTNVVLLDQEDNQILAMVRDAQKSIFFPLLIEGKVYQISNTKVVSAPKKFKPVECSISLLFFHGTRIELAEDTGLIPRHKFKLTALEHVANLVNATNSFIDVIGLVTDYSALERAANGAHKLGMKLADERNKEITVALWEGKAYQFLGALQSTQNVLVFVVVSGLLTKAITDKPTLSSTDATNCYLNLDYKSLNDLMHAILVNTDGPIAILPPPADRQIIAVSGNILQRLTVQEILAYRLPPGKRLARCICYAEIVAVLNGNDWCYSCCPNCGRKVNLIGHDYYCYICAEDVPELKQGLIIRVRDPTATTTFTLFSEDIERLVSFPIAEVMAENNQMHDNPTAEVPPVFNNVVGKTCAFDVVIRPYNTNLGYEDYTIVKLSECSPESDAPGAGTI